MDWPALFMNMNEVIRPHETKGREDITKPALVRPGTDRLRVGALSNARLPSGLHAGLTRAPTGAPLSGSE